MNEKKPIRRLINLWTQSHLSLFLVLIKFIKIIMSILFKNRFACITKCGSAKPVYVYCSYIEMDVTENPESRPQTIIETRNSKPEKESSEKNSSSSSSNRAEPIDHLFWLWLNPILIIRNLCTSDLNKVTRKRANCVGKNVRWSVVYAAPMAIR